MNRGCLLYTSELAAAADTEEYYAAAGEVQRYYAEHLSLIHI